MTSALSALVPFWLIRRDRAKLAARGEAHPWNAPTFACAVVVFGVLAIPAHYWALRRNRMALAWVVALAALVALVAGR